MLFSRSFPKKIARLSFTLPPATNTTSNVLVSAHLLSFTGNSLGSTPRTVATMANLKIHNSLKPGAPVPFVPKQEGKISWYACGPTVYDHSHLGHARNYVSTDIIRRILKDYFGYNVKFVMNITDVDDKVGGKPC